MLRVAVPYGVLNSTQLRGTAHRLRETIDRGYAHVTTRQNFQFNWPSTRIGAGYPGGARPRCKCTQSRPAATVFATSPRIRLPASRPMKSKIRESGANCCASGRLCIRSFPSLPRKFKIAVTVRGRRPRGIAGARHRLAALRKNEAGQAGFEGSRRRGPRAYAGDRQDQLRAFLPRQDLLSYLEAILTRL